MKTTKPIRIYLHNQPYKVGKKRTQTQTSFLYSPGMSEEEFGEINVDDLERELAIAHAESYIGCDDNMVESEERYIENRWHEHLAEAYQETIEAYNDPAWDRGYRVPEGQEYNDMVALGYARDQLKQERQKYLHTHELA